MKIHGLRSLAAAVLTVFLLTTGPLFRWRERRRRRGDSRLL